MKSTTDKRCVARLYRWVVRSTLCCAVGTALAGAGPSAVWAASKGRDSGQTPPVLDALQHASEKERCSFVAEVVDDSALQGPLTPADGSLAALVDAARARLGADASARVSQQVVFTRRRPEVPAPVLPWATVSALGTLSEAARLVASFTPEQLQALRASDLSIRWDRLTAQQQETVLPIIRRMSAPYKINGVPFSDLPKDDLVIYLSFQLKAYVRKPQGEFHEFTIRRTD